MANGHLMCKIHEFATEKSRILRTTRNKKNSELYVTHLCNRIIIIIVIGSSSFSNRCYETFKSKQVQLVCVALLQHSECDARHFFVSEKTSATKNRLSNVCSLSVCVFVCVCFFLSSSLSVSEIFIYFVPFSLHLPFFSIILARFSKRYHCRRAVFLSLCVEEIVFIYIHFMCHAILCLICLP